MKYSCVWCAAVVKTKIELKKCPYCGSNMVKVNR